MDKKLPFGYIPTSLKWLLSLARILAFRIQELKSAANGYSYA